MSEGVNHIFVVREGVGSPIKKVSYIPTGKSIPKRILYGLNTIRKEKIDIILSYYIFPHGVIGAILKTLTRKKFILSIIGDDYFRIDGSVFGRFAVQCADLVLVTGSNRKGELQRRFPNKKIEVMPNSLDTSVYRPIRIEKRYDVIFINSTGYKSIPEFKNHKTAFQIISQLPDMRFAWVGDAPEQRYPNLEVLGVRKDIPKLLNLSKLLLLTSSQEGMPSVILEALACGVPVVSSKVGDISTVVKAGRDGLLVEDCNDVESFINGIQNLLNDRETYRKMSANTIETANKYSYENVSKIWGNLIGKL
jgi:glycosyltransferase involved in cell wall biosynthesis